MHRILFEKLGPSVWMSHLDTVRLMQRAFRRAGVVLHHSQGYTPHAYVSMPLPLSVGTESLCEILEYELDGELTLSPDDLNAVLPEGIRVLAVYDSEIKTKYMEELQAELRLFYDAGVPDTAVQELSELLARNELFIEKRTKRGMEETDIRQDGAWEYPLIGHICDYIAENPDLCRCLLLNPRSDRLAKKLADIMKQKGQKVQQKMGLEIEAYKADYIHQFIAYGFMGVVKQWLMEEMPLSKEEMMELAEKMVRPIFQILIPSEKQE